MDTTAHFLKKESIESENSNRMGLSIYMLISDMLIDLEMTHIVIKRGNSLYRIMYDFNKDFIDYFMVSVVPQYKGSKIVVFISLKADKIDKYLH